eukprot:gene15165-15307_t
MNRMYRFQRYIYDFTRKPYLLGRDRMIAALQPHNGATILEIGCGTGRNLIKTAGTYPETVCYGIDISSEMLETAQAATDRAGLSDKIKLAEADATDFSSDLLFGRSKFDRIFISYALSMIPEWRKVLGQAVQCLAAGGILHIVDFGQQQRLPGLFKSALFTWLGWFSVIPRATLVTDMQRLAVEHGFELRIEDYYGGYAVHLVVSKPLR